MGSMVSGNHAGAKHMSGRFMQTFPNWAIELAELQKLFVPAKAEAVAQ